MSQIDDGPSLRRQVSAEGLADGELWAVGGELIVKKHNLAAVAGPTANDDSAAGYSIGSIWIYGSNVYLATAVGVGAAAWRHIYPASASLDSDLEDIAALSPVNGDLLMSNSLPKWTKLAKGSTYQVLQMGGAGSQPTWGQVALAQSSAVTGVLGLTNGGLGFSSSAAGDLFYSSASNTPNKLAIGSNGQVLTSASGLPTWQDAPANVKACGRCNPSSISLQIISWSTSGSDVVKSDSSFGTSTADRIIVPYTGKYWIGAFATLPAIPALTQYTMLIQVNGSDDNETIVKLNNHRASGNSDDSCATMRVKSLTANDYLRLKTSIFPDWASLNVIYLGA